jgi:hypothetical protein
MDVCSVVDVEITIVVVDVEITIVVVDTDERVSKMLGTRSALQPRDSTIQFKKKTSDSDSFLWSIFGTANEIHSGFLRLRPRFDLVELRQNDDTRTVLSSS